QSIGQAVAGGGTREHQDLAGLRVNEHRLGVLRPDREPEMEAGGRLGWADRLHAGPGWLWLGDAVDHALKSMAHVVADVADVESAPPGPVRAKLHRLPVDVGGGADLERAPGLTLLVDREHHRRVFRV